MAYCYNINTGCIMKRLIVSVCSLASFCFSPTLKADDFFDGYLLSPNATDLGHYGDVAVSYYTGKCQISIPLFSTNQLGTSFDMSLSYDGSGILMNSLPGWTGHNWTISCGGCISRIKQGVDDEFVYPNHFLNFFQSTQNVYGNYFNNCTVIPDLNPDTISNFTDDCLNNDYSADIFVFNFMGIYGKFFLGNDGYWKVDCDRNIKVDFNYNDDNNFIYPFYPYYPRGYSRTFLYPKTIKGFTLIDENGTKYIFGSQVEVCPSPSNTEQCATLTSAIEYSIPFGGIGGAEFDYHWSAMNWYLTAVKDRFDRTLYEFHYSRGYFITECHRLTFDGEARGEIIFPYSMSLTSPVYLDSITTYDNLKLVFNFEDAFQTDLTAFGGMYNNYTLEELFGINPNGYLRPDKIDGESFAYSYLQDPLFEQYHFTYSSDNARRVHSMPVDFDDPLQVTALKYLKDIELFDSNGEKKQTVELEYSNIGPRMHLTGVNIKPNDNQEGQSYVLNYNSWNRISEQDYVTTNVDHWGYFKRIGTLSLDQNYNLSCKDAQFTNEGLLSSIVYPTGGCTCFVYEQNQYTKFRTPDRSEVCDCTPTYAGGARIKEMRTYSDEDCLHLLYSKEFEYYDGQLYSKPKYNYSYKILNTEVNSSYSFNIFRSESILPLKNSFGVAVGYSMVKETHSDGSYNIYKYSNLSDTPIDEYNKSQLLCEDITPFDSYSERNYLRGRLLSKSTFDNNNNLCLSDTFIYRGITQVEEDTYSSCSMNKSWLSLYRWEIRWPNLFGRNVLSEGMMALIHCALASKYRTFYPKYDVVETIQTRYYPDGHYTLRTEYDKSDSIINNGEAVVRKCNSVTTKQTNGDSVNSFKKLAKYKYFLSDFYFPEWYKEEIINGETANIHVINYNAFGNHFLPSKETKYYGSVSEEYENGITGTPFITYDSYDSFGNLLKYTKAGFDQTTLTWNSYGKLLQRSQCGMTTNYTYNSMGQIESIEEPSGYTTTFEYDFLGRLIKKSDDSGVLQKFNYHYRTNE